MEPVHNFSTSLTVKAGALWVPGLDKVLSFPTDVTKTGLTWLANTNYYLYAYENAGVPDVEVSTTTPEAPYLGGARTKGGASPSTSHRYLHKIRTDAAATPKPHRWRFAGGWVYFLADTEGDPFRRLTDGRSATFAPITFSVVVSPGCRAVQVLAINRSAGEPARLSNPEAAGAVVSVPVQRTFPVTLPLSESQELQYRYDVSPGAGNGLVVDLLSYQEAR